jgi:hypothetical protein
VRRIYDQAGTEMGHRHGHRLSGLRHTYNVAGLQEIAGT